MKRRKLDQCDTKITLWPDLLPELWTYIAQHLESALDKARFRSVCKLWRSSLPPPVAFVPTLIPSPFDDDHNTFNYMLQERTIYRVHGNCPFLPDKDLLIEVEQIGQLKFRPYSIFHKRSICDDYLLFQKKINMVNNDLGFSISYMSKFYTINPHRFNLNLWKIAVIEDVILAITRKGELILLRLSSGDAMQWMKIEGTRKFDDIVEYKGNFFVIHRYGKGFILDRKILKLSQIVGPVVDRTGIYNTEIKGYKFIMRRKRLVFDFVTGRLYLLIVWKKIIGLSSQGNYVPIIKIYRFNPYDSEWIEVGSIGNSVLFVGCDFSFCAHARDLIPCVRYNWNCIYFDGDSSFEWYENIEKLRVLFKEFNVDDHGMHVYHISKGHSLPA